MPILHIEHEVGDFDTWKRTAFDADPIGRARSGVRRYRVSRSVDDPNYVMIELEFATTSEAEAMHTALQKLWRNPLAQIGRPTARIMEIVEANELDPV
jgi:hypothetical protein